MVNEQFPQTAAACGTLPNGPYTNRGRLHERGVTPDDREDNMLPYIPPRHPRQPLQREDLLV